MGELVSVLVAFAVLALVLYFCRPTPMTIVAHRFKKVRPRGSDGPWNPQPKFPVK